MRRVPLRAASILVAAGLLLSSALAVGAYASDAAPAPEETGLTASTSSGTAAKGDRIQIEGSGWPALTQVQAVVCGDLAVGGSNACDQTTGVLAVASVDGKLDIDFVVGNPPRPCPCVIRVASYQGPALAVDIPFVVEGHPIGTPPAATLPMPDLTVTDVRLEGGGGIGALFGAAPARRLVVTVENRGSAAAVNPEVLVGVGKSDKTEATTPLSRDITIEPLQSQEIVTEVELPFAAFGRYHVVGSVGEGSTGTTFSTEWGAYPWGLFALNFLGLLLLAWAIRWRLRWHKARPVVAREQAESMLSRPYLLPDVVYVEAVGGFLVSPKAVGKAGLIKKVEGRLEQRDLVSLLSDPDLANGASVIRDLGDGSTPGSGAAVVDLRALDLWLNRRRPGAGASGTQPSVPDEVVSAGAVVDVEAVDRWLEHREKRSSQRN